MGARTNFTFHTADGDLTLYSHWGGESKQQDLARALSKAMKRIDMGDTSYALRIIIDNLTIDGRDSETGYGIYVGCYGGEEQYYPVTVDLTNNTVIDNSGTHTIFDYVAYHTVLAEKQG